MSNIWQALATKMGRITPALTSVSDSPDELLGDLFQDVQSRRIYDDSLAFVDMVPALKLKTILKEYAETRFNPGFDLNKFVERHFEKYLGMGEAYTTNPKHTAEQHIHELWNVLRHTNYKSTGSLIGLPRPYIVSGGRYTTLFYWDSYFTMLGLAVDGQWRDVEDMVKNFAFMLRKFGHIPNGNRTYYFSRSQPPFFAPMVRLLAAEHGRQVLVEYLPYMLIEYAFWTKGQKKLRGNATGHLRVVQMPGGEVLNRYFDSKTKPRPEGYIEDIHTALAAHSRMPSQVYIDLRAAAESGWDFSSRWCTNPLDLSTICTTQIVPTDLNALLVVLEETIADAYRLLKQNGRAGRYQNRANARREAINRYCWNEKEGYYFDFNLATQQQMPHKTVAAGTLLWAGVPNQEQADRAADFMRRELLRAGGLLTTALSTGQQWDAPNGWAPLQWMAIKGLRRYNHHDLAEEIKKRWIAANLKVFNEKHKMVEKYNVADPNTAAGGGEYVLQDGFGWTNGVLLALLREDALHLQ